MIKRNPWQQKLNRTNSSKLRSDIYKYVRASKEDRSGAGVNSYMFGSVIGTYNGKL
jgi:hypothetical protein